jgi:predicted transcriptional regulator
MDVEDVFCSRVRMKILKILAQLGELNISEITRRLGVNYQTTVEHLDVLEAESILQHKTFGRMRLYRINARSPKAKAIQALLDAWKEPEIKNERLS